MASTQPEGYLAVPTTGERKPILVLHAWWGLNETIKTFCDHLAEHGFTAFAPDLYHGKVTDTIEGAEALSSAIDDKKAFADIAWAIKFVKDRSSLPEGGIAVIGFSFGAYFSLAISNSTPDEIHSVIVFYGTGPDDFNKSKARYLGHFAEEDKYEPKEYVDGLEESLQSAGLPVTFYRYPGTGHWFFEPDRTDAFDKAAADLAWERTLAFLKE